MALSEDARLIESIMFLENDFLSAERLSEMTGFDQKRVKKALSEIGKEFVSGKHGFVFEEKVDGVKFVPDEALYPLLKNAYGKKVDRRLSRAAIETLSIIAYSQPITRSEIDHIRGVASDSIVRLLREREYIKVVGRKDVPGHPCLWATTKKFLFEFNLKSIADLPKMSDGDKERFIKEDSDET